MSNTALEFGGFLLEPGERRLTRAGAVVEISGRYLDALLLLVRHPGELITKDRFMAEVWRGVPVTDEALTQCIRSLRRALGDQAGRPRFIETVPRHGYRFVAEVTAQGAEASPTSAEVGAGPAPAPDAPQTLVAPETPETPEAPEAPEASPSAPPATTPLRSPSTTVTTAEPELKGESPFKSWSDRSELLLVAAAGLVGGAAAGLIGGIGYGLLAATEPPAGTGAVSILLVMTCLCLLVGVLGGLGVGSGVALGRLIGPGRLFPLMAGGAAGGMMVGALGRLIGLDAFSLLIGSRPLAITGGSEGLLIGALAGAALWLAERDPIAPPSAAAAKGALFGALAGLLVTLGGGKMMAGSLAGLAAAHPEASLGTLLGQLSPALLLAAGAIEGAIFIAALTFAFVLVLRPRRAG